MTDQYTPPPAPPGPKDAGAALWTETVAEVEFEPHNLKILAEAALTLDLIGKLQEHLDHTGPIVDSPQGLKANPAAVEVRQQRITSARLLAALKIPTADGTPAKQGAPRGVYGLRGA